MDNMYLSWADVHNLCRTMAIKLSQQEQFEEVLAVTRGGMIPAAIIAHELSVRTMGVIGAISYTEDKERKGLELSFPAGLPKRGERVLIVDDIVASGDTFRAIRKCTPNLNATYAAMTGKAASGLLDDILCGMIVPDITWVVFPWERS